jgi:hypothetical protein
VRLKCGRTYKTTIVGDIPFGRSRSLDHFPLLNYRTAPFCLAADKARARRKKVEGIVIGQKKSLGLYLSIYLRFYSPYGPWPPFQFLNLYTVGRTPWTWNQPFVRPLPTHKIKAHRHPCLEWDLNPRSQCSNGEGGSCFRPRGHCDRQDYSCTITKSVWQVDQSFHRDQY